MQDRSSPWQRWRLVAAVTLALLACAAGLWVVSDDAVGAVRAFVRLTARSSMLLFCLAFTASALHRRWPGAWSAWQRENRRYLGLSFAASHALHGLALIAFAHLDPQQFAPNATPAMFLLGGLGYAVIVAMAATSFERSAAWLGPIAWRRLHTWGSWLLWLQFVIAFGKRVPAMPGYTVFVALLLAALAVRVTAASSRPAMRRAAMD